MKTFLKLLLPFNQTVALGPLQCTERRKDLERQIAAHLLMTQHRVLLVCEQDVPQEVKERVIRFDDIKDIKTGFNQTINLQQFVIERNNGTKIFLRLKKEDGEQAELMQNHFKTRPSASPDLLSTLKAKLLLNNPELEQSYLKYVVELKLVNDKQFWADHPDVVEFQRLRQVQLDMQISALRQEQREHKLEPRFQPADQILPDGPFEVDYNSSLPNTDPRIKGISEGTIMAVKKEAGSERGVMQVEFEQHKVPLLDRKRQFQKKVQKVKSKILKYQFNLQEPIKLSKLSKEGIELASRTEQRLKPVDKAKEELYKRLLVLIKLQYKVLEKGGNASDLYEQINSQARRLGDEEYDRDIRQLVSRSLTQYQSYLKREYV